MRDKFLHHLSTLGTGLFALVLVVFTYLNGQERLSAQILVMLILTSGVGWVIKFFYRKKRPDFDPKVKYPYPWLIRKAIEIDEQSFPSLHAARSVGLFMLLSSHFTSVPMRVFFLLLVLLTSWSRIKLKRHDWNDIVGGFVLGLIISLCVVFWL